MQYEHVVLVLVGAESLSPRRRDVGVRLDRMTERQFQPPAIVRQRRPPTMHALKNHGGTVRELVERRPRVDHPGRRLSARPGRLGVAGGGQSRSVFDQPKRRQPQARGRDDQIDVVKGKEVGEPSGVG